MSPDNMPPMSHGFNTLRWQITGRDLARSYRSLYGGLEVGRMAWARLLGNRGPVQVLGIQVYSTSPAAKPPFLHHRR